MDKNCLVCGVVLCKKENENNYHFRIRKYCSRKCSLKVTAIRKQDVHRIYTKGEKHFSWKPKVLINCKFCGKDRFLAPWELAHGIKFCSAKCYQTWHRGTNSPVYKGEKAVGNLRIRIHQLPEYVEWRTFVFRRDNYTCQECGQRGGSLEVHHNRISFAKLLKKYKIDSTEKARNCTELFDKKNGQTLCRACHRKTDDYPKNLLTKRAS